MRQKWFFSFFTLALTAFVLLLTITVSAQDRKVTGRVTNEATGEALGGVSILIKGARGGTATDAGGNFSVNIKSGKALVLVFSYSGFEDQSVPVGSGERLDIKLKASDKKLDEVVIIGYGTVRKRDLTGSVVSVKGDEIRKIAASNLMETIQGKVAGVDIVRTKGLAGSGVSVAIRGNRSITAGNGPLYIIDGIQFDAYPFQDINTNDVESMEVLKDASSTAIYGSRGANGVIIITTKKGSNGKVKVSASSYYGVSEIAGYPKPMTGPQFANLKRQAARTAGKWNSTADDPAVFLSAAELAAVTNKVSTYWPGLLINKGSQQDYGVGVSGGNDKTKVYFSFDYYKEKGVLKNDYSGRYTLRLNIDQTIAGTFKVGLQSQLTYYDVNSRADGVLTVANKELPYYTPFNPDGSLVKYPGATNQFNPLFDDLTGAYINKTNITRILSTAYAEWKPISGLTLRSNLGVSNSSSRNGYFEDANTVDRAIATGSLSSITNSTSTDLTWDNVVNWQKKFGEHSIEITALTSYLSRRSDNAVATGTGQLLPGQSYNALQNNPSNVTISSGYTGSNLLSGAFRLNYGYKGKYLLTVTGREDGASVLATGKQWSFFPSAAAAWRIIDENFMRSQHLFSDLKLRASYGVTGNAAVGAYQTQSGLLLIPFEWNDQSALAYGLDPQTGNPNLKWELTGSADAGIDFALFKGRVSASVDYYDSRTHDLLLTRALPFTSGESKILQNIGKTRNNGIEVSLKTINIQSKDLTWSTSLTYTRNKERIVELVGKQSDIANKWIIGSPVNSFYDYRKTGIWQTADSAVAKSYGYKPGDIRVRDISGPAGKPDGKIDANNDRKVLGSAVPDYSFGFSNDVRWRNFDLNVYVFGRIGQMFTSAYANKFEPNAIENGANVNYWTPENPTNDYPRPDSRVSRAGLPFATTLGYKDGSFVKIRNITLGYTLPSVLTQRWHLNGLRIYASMKNYFTFSKVKDYDPEGGGSFEGPLTKLVVTGLSIDL
jgi:TonB-linked SusC/RagA family outer membrane protein